MKTQTEAQRLAALLEQDPSEWGGLSMVAWPAAAELRRLEAENLRLASEVVNRNRRALEGDEHKAAFDRLYDKYENLEAEAQALRGAVPEPCYPSITTYSLAEMIMSDCGHSSNNQRLLDRIAARIDKRIDAVRAERQSYVPVDSNLRDGNFNHPNDKEPRTAACIQALHARGDNEGQGLDGFWKWGFAAGFNDALAAAPQPAAQPLQNAMQIVIQAMQEDPGYAWSWHCNIAMAFFDAGGNAYIANQGAARFMRSLAAVEPAHELPAQGEKQ